MNTAEFYRSPKAWSLAAACTFYLFHGAGAAHAVDRLAPLALAAAQRDAKAALLRSNQDLPLSFRPDINASDSTGEFVVAGKGYNLHLTADAAQMDFANKATSRRESLRMSIAGANPHARAVGIDELTHSNVQQYAKVAYRDIYPGVDVSYYGNRGALEYDFSVAPGADPEQIRLSFPGISGLKVDPSSGELIIKTADGADVHHGRPVVYQPTAAGRVAIDGSYQVIDGETVGYTVAKYDQNLPLIIDPTEPHNFLRTP